MAMSVQIWGNWLMIGLLIAAFIAAVILRYPGHRKETRR